MKSEVIPPHVQGPLCVAAKAGFLTKRIWGDFFSTGNRRWRNRRWKSLMDMGLFSPVADYGFVDSAVTLSEAGKLVVTSLGLEPIRPPGAKNLWHDEELIRLALFLERQGWLSDWMTEQELKTSGELARLFKNQNRAEKTPDLLIRWKTPQGPVPWAVELERTRKEFTRYYDMVGAYKGISGIDSVLVIAASASIEANIKKAQAKMGYPQSQRPMLFASMSEVSLDPALCELRSGENRITLVKLAQALTGKKTSKQPLDGKEAGPEVGPGGAYPKGSF